MRGARGRGGRLQGAAGGAGARGAPGQNPKEAHARGAAGGRAPSGGTEEQPDTWKQRGPRGRCHGSHAGGGWEMLTQPDAQQSSDGRRTGHPPLSIQGQHLCGGPRASGGRGQEPRRENPCLPPRAPTMASPGSYALEAGTPKGPPPLGDASPTRREARD